MIELIDRTIKFKSEKTNGRYPAAASIASSNGGTSALAWESPNGVAHGNEATITTDTYSFGTKTSPATVFFDDAVSAWERGVENTAFSGIADGAQVTETDGIYNSLMSLSIKDGSARHSNSERYYQGETKCKIGTPQEFEDNGRNSGNGKVFIAWWQRAKYNTAYLWDFTPDSDNGVSFQKDEPITVDGGSTTGVFAGTGSSSGWLAMTIDGNADNDSALAGVTITGDVSGASCVFPATPDNGNNMNRPGSKTARIWDDPAGSTGDLRASIAAHDFYLQEGGSRVQLTDSGGNTGLSAIYDTQQMPSNEWQLWEYELDKTNGTLRHWVNGRLRGDATFSGPIGDSGFGIGLQFIGVDGGVADVVQQTDFDEIYFDMSFHRVYLADAADWASVTHKELQRTTAWTNDRGDGIGEVGIAWNFGGLSGTKYLYVCDGSGDPVTTTGVEVS